MSNAAGAGASRATTQPGGTGAVNPRKGHHRRANWAAVGFVTPLVIYLVVFYAYPLIQNFALSLHRYDRATFVSGGAPFVGLDIYREVIAQPRFWRVVSQTATFTLVSISVQYVIGLALAVFFQRNFRLSATLRALFLVPWLLPVIVSGTTWQWMMNPDNGASEYPRRLVRCGADLVVVGSQLIEIGDHRQHLAGYSLQPGHLVLGVAEYPPDPL